MSEIQHTRIASFLKESAVSSFPAACLVHGQEMIVERSTRHLVEKLLDGAQAHLCCEKVDGMVENLPDVIEGLNTYGFLGGPKIVIFSEAKLFEGKGNSQQMVERVAEAWEDEDEKQAAKHFINLCSRFEIDMDGAMHGHAENAVLKALRGRLGTDAIGKLAAVCRSQGWTPSDPGDHAALLLTAIERGFPQDHYLIVTVHTRVPKNLKLYKSFRDHGIVIDCNVPQGERRSDKAAQEVVLRRTLDDLLARAGKQASEGAFQYLCRFTGFDPRTFAQNVEKLIDFSGRRKEITEEDIQAVVKRTKADPVFELTNSVADRNLAQSLFYTQALLDAKWHPLQILSALANQIRKLLLAKSFVLGEFGGAWGRGMSYPQFQNAVMPSIEAHDKKSRTQSAAWQEILDGPTTRGKRTKKGQTDLVLAVNPKSPYPVYQTLVKSENFSLEELTGAMVKLNQSDLSLKSSGQDPTLVLKKVIMEICGTLTKGRHWNGHLFDKTR